MQKAAGKLLKRLQRWLPDTSLRTIPPRRRQMGDLLAFHSFEVAHGAGHLGALRGLHRMFRVLLGFRWLGFRISSEFPGCGTCPRFDVL